MNYFSDDALLNGLKDKRTDSIRYLYREYFPLARSIVEKNSGSYEDAEDVFQDGIIVLYQKILTGPLVLNCSLRTFFFSICRNIWMQRLDRKWRLLYQDDLVSESVQDYDAIPLEINEEKLEKTRLYQLHFLSLPPDCQKILRMFLSNISLKEISEKMGFKDAAYAKTRKYLCKNMLRKKIIKDPRYKMFLHHE
ncbi:MAG: sigma-70 family RNA polymerase sigma factor [Bacteroidetes bacterium]|nr:sigma-70 family RNA polymerase sigma factor [Bacteroidota bacterium]